LLYSSRVGIEAVAAASGSAVIAVCCVLGSSPSRGWASTC
jgi:hypothetical protein